MSIVRKKGRTIRSAERNVISNIIRFCEYEAYQNKLLVPVTKYINRAAMYCKVSSSTIKTIKKEVESNVASTSDTIRLSTTGKNRLQPEHRRAIANLHRIDRRVIIEILEDFYINKKKVLTCDKLLPVLKDKINFNWKFSTLRKLLRLIGFKWKQCKSRRILVERQDIVNKRYNYLQMLKSFKEKNSPIFYLDETWVDNNLSFKKYWENEEFADNKNVSSGLNRLVIVHIGSKTGFLDGCKFLLQVGAAKGDQINSEIFEKWIKEIVIPKLPSHSVIVMDNARYHNRIVNKPPNKSSMKKDIIEYLSEMGVMCDETMRKCTLYELVLSVQPQEKTYEVDNLFESYGHKVLRLPPYMCELNPIELAWVKLENYIYENKTSGALSMQFTRELVEKGLQEITSGDWAVWCKHVETLENKYWSMDGIMEDAVDNLIIELGGSVDESGNDSDNDGYVGEEDDATASSEEESNDSLMKGSANFHEADAIDSTCLRLPVRGLQKGRPIIIKFVRRADSHTILKGQRVLKNQPAGHNIGMKGDAAKYETDHDYTILKESVEGTTDQDKNHIEHPLAQPHFLDDSLQNCPTERVIEKFESPIHINNEKRVFASVLPSPSSEPKRKMLDSVDKLFLSYAETFKKLRPATQGEFKMEMTKLMERMEMKKGVSTRAPKPSTSQ